jgi:hypothetical protein
MSILLYCVTEQAASPDVGTGVAALPVLHCRHAGVDALFSENNSAESWTGASLKQSAREFHTVLHRAFAAHAVVPFRFPTLMRDEDELAAHLRDNVAEYSAQLKKFENAVQMDISIAQPEPAVDGSPRRSGAEYLRGRQKQSDELYAVAKQIQELASETVQSWRDRPASHGLKLYGLVDRASVSAFHERLKKLSAPPNTSVRVSGPWPVTEFLELKQR